MIIIRKKISVLLTVVLLSFILVSSVTAVEIFSNTSWKPETFSKTDGVSRDIFSPGEDIVVSTYGKDIHNGHRVLNYKIKN